MLEIRPDCERCGRDVPAHESGAFICSFECTFCENCVVDDLKGICPNCGGVLLLRPTRSLELLTKFPASDQRKYSK